VVVATNTGGVVVAAGRYEGVLKALLLSAKERGGLGLLPVLADRLTAAVTALGLAAPESVHIVLVPVPSVPSAVAERGVDFTAMLAKLTAARLRKAGVAAVVARGLRHVRRPADQAGLGVFARQANLTGALSASPRLPAGQVIVIDDIITTGASIAEATRALAEARRVPLGAATVAATMRQRGAD
jgi:predicted amidophosphoribosyltransferase